MRKERMFLVGAVLAATLWSSSSFAAEKSPEPLTGSSCLPTAVQAPLPLWLTSSGCYAMSDCMDDNYCWASARQQPRPPV